MIFDFVCTACGGERGWHTVSCRLQSIPTLGMGTVPIGRDDDDLSDCAPEGFAALEHVAPPPQEHAA